MNVLKTYLTAAECVTEEFDGIPLQLTKGALPKDLVGTLFRNGNGRFKHQGVLYGHLFDGDGMISKFTFQNGQVIYQNRYVRTKEFVKEEQEGKMLYRSFGTNRPGGIRTNFMRMRFKNAANTSVVYHGGKLMALWEGGLPHEIDPISLSTLSRYTYEGVLENSFSTLDHLIFPELAFSAHPKIHPTTGDLYNFGTVPGTKQRLVLYKVAPDGKAEIDQVIAMPGLTFAHDFVLTETGKKIFFLPPVEFNVFKSFTGLDTPVGSIKANPNKFTKIMVIDDEEINYYNTDFGFIFHYANGYEQADNTLIVDAAVLPEFPSAKDIRRFMKGEIVGVPKGQLTRHHIDLEKGKVTKTLLSDHYCELGEVHPDLTGQPYQFYWSLGGSPDSSNELLTGIMKVDVENQHTIFQDMYPCLPSEPIFVPRPEAQQEDDGWIVHLLFNPDELKTSLVVLDGATLAHIAELELPHNIPLGFHGLWLDEIFE